MCIILHLTMLAQVMAQLCSTDCVLYVEGYTVFMIFSPQYVLLLWVCAFYTHIFTIITLTNGWN